MYRWVLKRGEIVRDIRGPRRERHLPVVLSLDEVNRFFAAVVAYKHRMILMTAYSAGLRISEVTHLQVSDIDSERMVIRVRQGKRSKDRYTVLSPALWEMLRHYCWAARPVSYLFTGRSLHKPMSDCQVQRACKEAQANARLIDAATRRSPTTPAATGTAPSVRAPPGIVIHHERAGGHNNLDSCKSHSTGSARAHPLSPDSEMP